MRYAAAFERLVWPILAERCRISGVLIACGQQSWSEGFDTIWRLAIERGALHLPDPDALHDRISVELLDRVIAAENYAGRFAMLAQTRPSEFWNFIWGFTK